MTISSNKISITVNGIDVLVEKGSSVLQACELVGIEIPRFCFHERLQIAGNCRMCLVEIEKSPKPQASCALPVMPGMKVFTDTPLVKKAREGVLEFLLVNHPLDCPICDQGGECDLQDQVAIFGSDRSRFFEHKRGVEDKNLGPLIKTIMTRCIHCTRCVRFATEVAGVEVLGTTSRGIDTEVGTYVEKMFNSELSGNVIDLCPVGALTSKPYAFTSRPWELRHTKSVDVMDSVGSNIMIDSRGNEIMRITPRLNEEINEEWISDKTRFAHDGLKVQRLTSPMIKDENGKFVPVDWPEAFSYIKTKIDQKALSLSANSIYPSPVAAGILGGLVDVEASFLLKKFISQFHSTKVTSEFAVGKKMNYEFLNHHLFNSSIQGIEESDLILLVGTNPRKEAAIINSRIKKRSLQGNFRIAYIGPKLSLIEDGLTYPVDHLGETPETLNQIASGDHPFSSELAQASNPMLIVGPALFGYREDSDVLMNMLNEINHNYSLSTGARKSIINTIQPTASQSGAAQLGLNGVDKSYSETVFPLKLLYCLGTTTDFRFDDQRLKLDKDCFIIYQGHHGDEQIPTYADVILPGAAYTEKDAIFYNTEGRPQETKCVLTPPGSAKEDWKIINALSEYIHGTTPYESRMELLSEIEDKMPTIKSIGKLPNENSLGLNYSMQTKNTFDGELPFIEAIPNFYVTCPVTKASTTMAKCVESLNKRDLTLKSFLDEFALEEGFGFKERFFGNGSVVGNPSGAFRATKVAQKDRDFEAEFEAVIAAWVQGGDLDCHCTTVYERLRPYECNVLKIPIEKWYDPSDPRNQNRYPEEFNDNIELKNMLEEFQESKLFYPDSTISAYVFPQTFRQLLDPLLRYENLYHILDYEEDWDRHFNSLNKNVWVKSRKNSICHKCHRLLPT